MYSTHSEGKSVVTERFIRTLKTKIYKYMTSISKNVYIDKLDDIVNDSIVLGLLDQLLIFSQLYLIVLLGLLTGLGLFELWHLIYPRFLTGFGMLVFTNLSLMEFQVRYSALFLLFSVIDNFEWFWMESLHKNIQLMREFLKAPSLLLHFSYYTLMTFLMMLSVILPSILMILLSIQSVIGHLICGNN